MSEAARLEEGDQPLPHVHGRDQQHGERLSRLVGYPVHQGVPGLHPEDVSVPDWKVLPRNDRIEEAFEILKC